MPPPPARTPTKFTLDLSKADAGLASLVLASNKNRSTVVTSVSIKPASTSHQSSTSATTNSNSSSSSSSSPIIVMASSQPSSNISSSTSVVVSSPSSDSKSTSSSNSNSSSSLSFLHPLDAHKTTSNQVTFPLPNSYQRVSSSSSSSSSSSGPSIRRKVALPPGHSPLDWATLKSKQRMVPQLQRYTLSDLQQHRTKQDLWISIRGKVYDCTQYLMFHPGGQGQMMRGAGKDATELFMKVHPWVNVDIILDKFHIGYLIPNNNSNNSNNK